MIYAVLKNNGWKPGFLIRLSIALHVSALMLVLADPGQWRWALGGFIANHIVLALAGLWPRCDWLGSNWTQLPDSASARNEVAMTIDDGPDPLVTPQVLDILDRYSAKATFFCIGANAVQYPDLCREIVRRGHAVENHSQRHCHNFSFLGYCGFLRELQAGQDTLVAITGQHPVFFRAPAGLRNPFLDPALHRLGLQLASWSMRGFDTRIGDAERVKSRLMRGLRSGAILLLHDGNSARTAAGIPVILEVLPAVLAAGTAAKLNFVTLRQARGDSKSQETT